MKHIADRKIQIAILQALDIDGDSANDRVYRTFYEGSTDTDGSTTLPYAIYRIEFGNGRRLEIPKDYDTGFPAIQAADIDPDKEKEILEDVKFFCKLDVLWYIDS